MRRGIVSLVCLTSLIASGPAFATNRDCAPIAAMTSANTKALQKLSLHIGEDGWVYVRYDGKSTFIGGAEDCELYGPADGFELSCSWDIETLQEAEGRLKLLKQKLEKCLPDAMEDRTSPSSVEGLTEHRRYATSVERDQDGDEQADISIRLYEHTRSVPSTFSLGISISH